MLNKIFTTEHVFFTQASLLTAIERHCKVHQSSNQTKMTDFTGNCNYSCEENRFLWKKNTLAETIASCAFLLVGGNDQSTHTLQCKLKDSHMQTNDKSYARLRKHTRCACAQQVMRCNYCRDWHRRAHLCSRQLSNTTQATIPLSNLATSQSGSIAPQQYAKT